MAEIKSKLTLDTKDAISSLDRLDSTLKSIGDKIKTSLEKSINTKGIDNVADGVDKVGKSLNKIPSPAKKVENSIDEIGNGIDKIGKKSSIFDKLGGSLSSITSGLFAGAGFSIAQKGLEGVANAASFLWEQANRADEIGTALQIGFGQAGLSGEALAAQLKITESTARSLGRELGVPAERLKELSAAAATLGGATGQANADLTKMAIGIEKATGGMIKGEAAIKLFSRGISNPEDAAALASLSKRFPELGKAMEGPGTNAEKLQKGLTALGPTFSALADDTQDAGAKIEQFKNDLSEGAQAIGGSFLAAFDTTKIFESFGDINFESIIGTLNTLGTKLGESFTKILGSVISAFAPLVDNVKLLFGDLFSGDNFDIGTLIDNITNQITSIIGVVQNLYSAISPIFLAIKEGFAGAFSGAEGADIGNVFNDIISALNKIIGFVKTLFEFLSPIITNIVSLLIDVGQRIVSLVSVIWDSLNQIFDVIQETFGGENGGSDTFAGIINFIGEALKVVAAILQGTLVVAIKIAQGIIIGIIKSFGDLFNNIKIVSDFIGGVFTGLWNALSDTFETVKNTISGVLNAIFSLYANVLKFIGVFEPLKKVLQEVWDFALTVFNGITDAVNGAIDSIGSFFSASPKAPIKTKVENEVTNTTKNTTTADSEQALKDIKDANEAQIQADKEAAAKRIEANKAARAKDAADAKKNKEDLSKFEIDIDKKVADEKAKLQDTQTKEEISTLQEYIDLLSGDVIGNYETLRDLRNEIANIEIGEIGLSFTETEAGISLPSKEDIRKQAEENANERIKVELEALNKINLGEEAKAEATKRIQDLKNTYIAQSELDLSEKVKDINDKANKGNADDIKKINDKILIDKFAAYDAEAAKIAYVDELRKESLDNMSAMAVRTLEIYRDSFSGLGEALSKGGLTDVLSAIFDSQLQLQSEFNNKKLALDETAKSLEKQAIDDLAKYNEDVRILEAKQKDAEFLNDKKRAEELIELKKQLDTDYAETKSQNDAKINQNTSDSTDIQEAAVVNMYQTMALAGASLVASLIDGNKSVLQSTAEMLLKIVDMYIAQMWAAALADPKSVTTFGAIGLVIGTILTGLIKAKVGDAFQQKLEGGIIEGGGTGISGMTSTGQKWLTINENSKPEFVINAKSTEKYRGILEAINDDKLDGKSLTKTLNIDNIVMRTSGIEDRLDLIAYKLEQVESAQLSSYNRSAVQVEMTPLQARGTDFYSSMKNIKKRSLKG